MVIIPFPPYLINSFTIWSTPDALLFLTCYIHNFIYTLINLLQRGGTKILICVSHSLIFSDESTTASLFSVSFVSPEHKPYTLEFWIRVNRAHTLAGSSWGQTCKKSNYPNSRWFHATKNNKHISSSLAMAYHKTRGRNFKYLGSDLKERRWVGGNKK